MKIKNKKVSIAPFRPESDAKPVDALPGLSWPNAAREFKHYFDNYPPDGSLSIPDWRYICLKRNSEPSMLIGRHVSEERVDRVMIAREGQPGYKRESGDAPLLSGRNGQVYIARFYDV